MLLAAHHLAAPVGTYSSKWQEHMKVLSPFEPTDFSSYQQEKHFYPCNAHRAVLRTAPLGAGTAGGDGGLAQHGLLLSHGMQKKIILCWFLVFFFLSISSGAASPGCLGMLLPSVPLSQMDALNSATSGDRSRPLSTAEQGVPQEWLLWLVLRLFSASWQKQRNRWEKKERKKKKKQKVIFVGI